MSDNNFIARADEVDEAGDLQDAAPASRPPTPARPILRREASAPPPPPRQPPPPAPPTEDIPQPTDSLSLAQLRNIVSTFPKLEPTAYAYTYEDTRSLPEELEEWFQYTQEDNESVKRAHESFVQSFETFSKTSWLELPPEVRSQFIFHQLRILEEGTDEGEITRSLESIAYLAQGTWHELENAVPDDLDQNGYEPRYQRALKQLQCIGQSAVLLCKSGAVPVLFKILVRICEEGRDRRQVNAILTTCYFMIEAGRYQGSTVRKVFGGLEPDWLQFLSHMIARVRWEDNAMDVPLTKIILLLWKSVLLLFGGSKELAEGKEVLSPIPSSDKASCDNNLTASPLDYHMFRQEIISKYPAYNPPPPLVPIEPNNTSLLPPGPGTLTRSASHDNLNLAAMGKSIFHQPLHIATPAPSPPPSPAGPGGKGGKKQNYQTNQNFPFLYPPLDSSSNELGGKGKAEMQDKLVGKRWEGSDVPASILEAGKLFASRMRMSRSLRQLWDVREEFIKFERGWEGVQTQAGDGKNSPTVEDLDDEELIPLDPDGDVRPENDDKHKTNNNKDVSKAPRIKETEDTAVQGRLDAIESFYRGTLPYLQSIVIVLLKVLLSNVTVIGGQAGTQSGISTTFDLEKINLPKRNLNLAKHLTGTTNHAESDEEADRAVEELNSIRTREITSKAISGFLLMLLKWFRFSHVLKFEYLTQLLLDSNYLPLALKSFALQDVDKAVDNKHDCDELDFFHFCRTEVDAGKPQEARAQDVPVPSSPASSVDSAQPPPIRRTRQPAPPTFPPASPSVQPRPEVDELGYPVTKLPASPITKYAPSFFFTNITTLRILQKLTKNHAHRALLLVQYKSSTILRKSLKVPQPSLRLYTLKLFKSQVPYCGRKWRQANMRVITAIYVFCRMGLRDEWISGGGMVDELVEGALGVERAWRGLVGFWHGRNYRDVLGPAKGADDGEEENDFFVRELEKMGWGVQGVGEPEPEDEVEEEMGPTEWNGGAMNLEG